MSELSASARKIQELESQLAFYQTAFLAAVQELGGTFFIDEAKFQKVPQQIVRRVTTTGIEFSLMTTPEEVQ